MSTDFSLKQKELVEVKCFFSLFFISYYIIRGIYWKAFILLSFFSLCECVHISFCCCYSKRTHRRSTFHDRRRACPSYPAIILCIYTIPSPCLHIDIEIYYAPVSSFFFVSFLLFFLISFCF